jgi:hypothetical protein
MGKQAIQKFHLLDINMEPVELTGKVILTSKPTDFGNENGKEHKTKPVVDPTWDYLCELADEALKVTGDRDQNALGDINLVETLPNGTAVYEFQFDS